MRVTEVVWLPQYAEKLLTKHHVLPLEAEDVLFGRPHVKFVERGLQSDEDLFAAYGQTEEGRYLVVFFILKAGHRALVISARDMDTKERKSYGRRK